MLIELKYILYIIAETIKPTKNENVFYLIFKT